MKMPEENTIIQPSEMSDEDLLNSVIELEYVYQEMVKPYYEKSKELLTELVKRKGLEFYFQDNLSGAVLKTTTLDGKFISFFPYTINRTRFSDEEPKQSLSNKEAEEKGFTLKLGDRRKKKV